MRDDLKTQAGTLVFLALITFFQLWPLSLHPHDSLYEQIDSLLNTWTLARIHQKILSEPLRLFEANIFYPYTNTLSFSEHMFPLAVVSLPVYYIFKNPLLTYNLLLFLCFFLNAYAMFLLVKRLTGHQVSSLVAGLIFAFSTYQMQHITHLQLQSSWLIPLSFLFLHKFSEEKKLKDSILFAVFAGLQALTCVYYGLFLFSLLIVVLPLFLLLNLRKIQISFLAKLILPLLCSGLVVILFSLPYFSLFKNFNFQRELTQGADFINYFAVFYNNVFLGKALSPLGSYEFYLFPGILALFLAGLFLLEKKYLFKNVPSFIRIIFAVFILVNVISVVSIFLTQGFELKLGLITLSGHNLSKPGYLALSGLFLYVFISFFFNILKKSESDQDSQSFFLYALILFWALFLSFGSLFTFLGQSSTSLPLPYKFFYDNFPGFKGIRAPSRYAVFVLLSVSVFAGYGFKIFWNEIKSKPVRAYLTIGLILFLNLEYLNVPQQRMRFPLGDDIPATYEWLKEQPGDFAIVELPFHPFIGDDAIYMYFSLFHNKKMLNGYSGFIPPSISYIRQVFLGFPSASSLDILNKLKVKYLILHLKGWKEERALRIQERIQEKYGKNLKLVQTFSYQFKRPNDFEQEFGQDLVYELIPPSEEEKELSGLVELAPEEWTVVASQQEDLLPYLKDGRLDTCWSTKQLKRTEEYLIINFKKPQSIKQISLFCGKFSSDFAVDFEVETLVEGGKWKGVELAYSPGEFVKNLIHKPQELVQNIYLDSKEFQSIRLTQVGHDPQYYWSVAEVKIYRGP